MSLSKYAKYKYSGTDWLGDVPEHWRVAPLWTLFRRTKRTGFEEEQLLSVYRDHGVVPKASRDDNNNKASDDLSVYQLVEPGDLAINKMKAWQGAVAISDYRGIVSPAYFIYESVHSESSRYLHYLLRSLRYITGYLALSKGIRVNQWDLEPQYHARMPVLLPSAEEQSAIAVFLDWETAKIDALIAEQEKLITLLAEKRRATISHAVTSGLNPDASMKDSGVAWLGEVPVYWPIAKLGLYASVENGTTPSRAIPEYWEDGDIPWLASGEVNQLYITEASEFITETALASCSLRVLPAGTVVVGLIGQGRTRGMSAMLRIRATINQNLAAICPGPHIESAYILYLLHAVYEWLREAGRGGNQAAMNCEMLSALRVPVPPLLEQKSIVGFIEGETARLDSLRAEAERAINLLKERRSALITATVTGQIDVRESVAQPFEEKRGVV